MRGIICFCKHFQYYDTLFSEKKDMVERGQKKRKGLYKDNFVVFICIEKGDSKKKYRAGLRDIRRRLKILSNKGYSAKGVVVLPFGHFSRNLEEPKKARNIIKEFIEILKEEFSNADIASFGTQKYAEFIWPGKRHDVSYFEY